MPENECLGNPLTGGVCAEEETHTSGSVAVPSEQVASGEVEEAGKAPPTEASGIGTVLLLEGDPAFTESISASLIERGYSVVTALNGADGVRQVLASDFTFVFCDTMMPGLRGDVFYRAVERIRPELCPHFVFTRGEDSDAQMTQFLTDVEGLVLKKPFGADSLNGVIAFAEIRRSYVSVFQKAGTKFQAEAYPAEISLDEKVARILERARAESQSRSVKAEVPDRQPQSPGSRSVWLMPVLGTAALVAVGFAMWHSVILGRFEALSLQRESLEGQASLLAVQVKRAEAMRTEMEKARSQNAQVAVDRAQQRWSPVLRAVLTAADEGIQLREFRASEDSAEERTWRFTAGGIAMGADPREVADRFRKNLQERLAKLFRGGASVQLPVIEDLPASASENGGERWGVFTVEAAMSLAPLQVLEAKEGE